LARGSAEETALSEETTEVEAKPKSSMLPVAIVAVLTVVLGGGVGAYVVGPMVAGGPSAEAVEGEDDEHAEEEGSGHGGGDGGGSSIYSIENLVVNPAGTQGTRFLIVSLALSPGNSEALAKLVAHDAEIRDTLLQVLAAKTIQELSDLSQRESVKEEMRLAAESVIRPSKITKVFLPQFVLQ
jgi:flagellar FliL protein